MCRGPQSRSPCFPSPTVRRMDDSTRVNGWTTAAWTGLGMLRREVWGWSFYHRFGGNLQGLVYRRCRPSVLLSTWGQIAGGGIRGGALLMMSVLNKGEACHTKGTRKGLEERQFHRFGGPECWGEGVLQVSKCFRSCRPVVLIVVGKHHGCLLSNEFLCATRMTHFWNWALSKP